MEGGEARRIECIFGNKYNLNELAVNWKWAIQGYVTRGLPFSLSLSPVSLYPLVLSHSLSRSLVSPPVRSFTFTRSCLPPFRSLHLFHPFRLIQPPFAFFFFITLLLRLLLPRLLPPLISPTPVSLSLSLCVCVCVSLHT